MPAHIEKAHNVLTETSDFWTPGAIRLMHFACGDLQEGCVQPPFVAAVCCLSQLVMSLLAISCDASHMSTVNTGQTIILPVCYVHHALESVLIVVGVPSRNCASLMGMYYSLSVSELAD